MAKCLYDEGETVVMSYRRGPRRGISMIEVIVVVAIVAILAVLTLNGVDSARESARSAVCVDHLRQLGIGFAAHHAALQAFPSNGGWDGKQTITAATGGKAEVFTKTIDGVAYHWGAPDPTAPPIKQTGGWGYSLLPYIDNQELFNTIKYDAGFPLYICPSRRGARAQLPPDSDEIATYSGGGWAWGKIDYATNRFIIRNRPGSAHPSDKPQTPAERARASRLSRYADILDGSANTILIGEKLMDPDRYDSGAWFWDEPFLLGGSYATSRSGEDVLPDRSGIYYKNNWGSAHTDSANFGFADGSVRPLKFGASPTIMRALLSPSARDRPQEP